MRGPAGVKDAQGAFLTNPGQDYTFEAMIYLITGIILSTVFGQIMKWAVVRGCSTAQVAAVNYFIAAGAAAAFGLMMQGLRFNGKVLAIGILGGVSYAIAVVVIFQVIRVAGIAITGTLMRVAVMVPVLGGIFFFKEMPTAVQWIGMGLTVASMILLRPAGSMHPQQKVGWAAIIGMILIVITNGAGFLAWKMIHFYGCDGQSQEFLCLLFGIPALTCAAESAGRRDGLVRAAIIIGILLGLTNVCSVSTSLEALRTIPSVIFFPVYSCGGVILNAGLAAVLWREQLTRENGAGIALGCLALVCMNPG